MENNLVYKITNPKGRIYIGQTTNFQKRKSRYKEMEKWDKFKQPIIGASIKKYGLAAHTISIIEENIELENLNEREIYWIEFYKSNNYKYPELLGMNCTCGGDVQIMEEITKEKLSVNSKNNVEIYQYALNGLFIQSFRSATFAAKQLNCTRRGIQSCLDNHAKTAYNYQWSYNKSDNIGDIISKKKAVSKPILQILNNKIIKQYGSCKDAERDGFSSSLIRKVCIGQNNSHKGYQWKYVNEEDIKISSHNSGVKKTILCKFLNQEEKLFKGITEASDYLNLSKAVVKSICGGFLKQKQEFTLQYII